MSNILITGVGSYLPKKIISNNELPVNLDTNDEWIKQTVFGMFLRYLVTSMLYLGNRKRVACVYGLIMHTGNVGRIQEKRVRYEV